VCILKSLLLSLLFWVGVIMLIAVPVMGILLLWLVWYLKRQWNIGWFWIIFFFLALVGIMTD